MFPSLTAVQISWVSRLGAHLSDARLEIIAEDRTTVPPEYKMLFNLSHLITCEDLTTTSSPTGNNEMLDDLKAEFLNNGVSIEQTIICALARRPPRPFLRAQ